MKPPRTDPGLLDASEASVGSLRRLQDQTAERDALLDRAFKGDL